MKIDAFVPCQIFEVAFRVGSREDLSKLERLVLEAIYEGVREPRDDGTARPGKTYFSDLVDLFALGYRPTLDLVVDLWRRAYLTVDEEGGIWLSAEVSHSIRQGRVGHLRGGLGHQRRQRIWQELLSGHVLFPQRRALLAEPGRIVPPVLTFGSFPQVGRQELISVLDTMINRSDDAVLPTQPLRVLSVNLGFVAEPGLAPAPQHALLQVRLECAWDAGPERLTFRLLDPGSLASRVRADMEAALGVAAETRLDHPFYVRLKKEVQGEQEPWSERPPERDEIALIRSKIQRVPQLDFGMVALHHGELCALASSLERRLEEAQIRRATARFLTGAAAHRQEVMAAVEQARQQLVLISPDLDYEALRWLGPGLKQAMQQRGVRVFLLWGRRAEAQLATRVANYLDDLKHEHGGTFFYSPRPMRTVARALLQDGVKVLVTSFPFLAVAPAADEDPGAPGWYLGAVVERSSAAVGPAGGEAEAEGGGDRAGGGEVSIATARELLAWLRSVVPVDELGLGLKRFDEAPSRLAGRRPDPPLLGSGMEAEAAYRNVAQAVWYAEWQAYAGVLETAARTVCGTARLVKEGEHQQLLWDLLRQPLRFVLVLSCKLSPEVVNPRLEELLAERLDGGTRMAIIYGRGGGEPVQCLARLAKRLPNAASVFALGGGVFDGEAVIADDTVLISGAGLLSFAGEYDNFGRRRQASQVGLLLRGGHIAQDLAEQLGRHIPGLPKWAAESPVTMHEEAGIGREPALSRPPLQKLLRALSAEESEPARAARLRQWFEESPEPPVAWYDLDELAHAGLPDLKLAAACCLAVRPVEEAPAERRRWLLWLAAHAWHDEEDALTAALLLPAIGDPLSPELPPRSLVLLAASRSQTTEFADGLIDWTAGLANGEAVVATACLAILAVLDGLEQGAECLAVLKDQLPQPLERCVAAVLEYWNEVHLPLSAAAIRRRLDRQRSLDLAIKGRATLRDKLITEVQRPHEFGLSRVTWEYLFGSDGPFAPLATAVEADDAPAAARWLEGSRWDQRALSRLLDEATREAMQRSDYRDTREERHRRIVGDRRTAAISRLDSIVEAALAWVDAVPKEIETAAERQAVARTRVLGEQVRGFAAQLRQLAEEASTSRLPEAPLLRQVAASLKPLEEALH